jgi:hypothetical protein
VAHDGDVKASLAEDLGVALVPEFDWRDDGEVGVWWRAEGDEPPGAAAGGA